MTVNYGLLVANVSQFNCFRLLFRWKGSIWKAILSDFCIWMICFLIIFFTINFMIDDESRRFMMQLAARLDRVTKMDGMNFILSFFVGAIVNRWMHILVNIGFIDDLALMIAFNIYGTSERTRIIRRNLVRYAIQAQLFIFRDVSVQVQKRFPTSHSMVEANFITEQELKIYESYDPNCTLPKYWLPILWAQTAIHRAREEEMFFTKHQYQQLNKKFNQWRNQLSEVANMDWVPIPLLYPQLVILVVNSYFIILLLARQVIFSGDKHRDATELIATLIHTSLEFLFYMGWLRMAEALINPMGEDDDDFEMNWLLDRNLKTGLAIVDRAIHHVPNLEKDPHWENEQPLLYAENTRAVNPLHGSAMQPNQPNDDQLRKRSSIRMVPLEDRLDQSLQSRRPSRTYHPKIAKSGISRFYARHGSTPNIISGRSRSSGIESGSPQIQSLPGSPAEPRRTCIFTESHKVEEVSPAGLAVFEEVSESVVTGKQINLHQNPPKPAPRKIDRSLTVVHPLDNINEENEIQYQRGI